MYAPDHNNAMNPFGCTGRMNGGVRAHWLSILIQRIGKLLLLILLAPFFILFASPCFCMALCFSITDRSRRNKWGRTFLSIIAAIIGFAIGCAGNIVAVPVIICIGIPTIIIGFFGTLYTRHRRASRRL